MTLKEVRNPDTHYNMDEPWRPYAKWSNPEPQRQILWLKS